MNSFIRLTHEFQFPVAAVSLPSWSTYDTTNQQTNTEQFHHAHETYLVPDLLKQSWPGNGTATPAVALFSLKCADSARKLTPQECR